VGKSFLSFLIFYLISSCNVYADIVNVIVTSDVLRDYKLFLKGQDPLYIQNFSGVRSRRDVVELILFQQALKIGNFKHIVNFTEVASYERILVQIGNGNALMSANTNWLSDVDLSVSYPTVATIANGEFKAGF
jgi:hypothetical protein